MAVSAVTEELLAVSGVRAIHDLHVWALTPSHPLVSVHVAVGECPAHCTRPTTQPGPRGAEPRCPPPADTTADPETVLRDATGRLQQKFGFAACTVQVERYVEAAGGCPHGHNPLA